LRPFLPEAPSSMKCARSTDSVRASNTGRTYDLIGKDRSRDVAGVWLGLNAGAGKCQLTRLLGERLRSSRGTRHTMDVP
jgi:hypothetical protein